MSKLSLIEGQGKIQPNAIKRPIVQQQSTTRLPAVPESKYVTAEQLDNSMNNIVEKLARKIEPESALTPEVRGMVKAVGEVQSLRLALKDPTSAGIEEATSTLVTSVLDNALRNITGGGQQQAQPTPLRNTLAQIAVNNLTGENSPLPQLMDALTNIVGKEKVAAGYDAGVQYIDQQQKQNNLPAAILQLDENSQEDVVAYAQQMGYSDVQYAQARLIEHKNMLHQEIEEYQRVQGGGQQSVAAEEPVVQQEPMRQQEPIREQPMSQQEVVVQKPIIQQEQYEQTEYEKDHVDPQYSKSLESPISKTIYDEEPINDNYLNEKPIIEEPVLKANKVIVLHGKPRKLTLAKDKVEPVIDDKDYEVKIDENLNIDINYSEGNEGNESLDDDVDDILSEIGE